MDCKEAEELLPGYALNALSPHETALVEAHLETCHLCTALLREHLVVASYLAQAAERLEPPERLKRSTMKAVGKHARRPEGSRRLLLAPPRLVLASAALVTVLLLAAVITIGLRMSGQIDDLQHENSELAAQLSQMAVEDEKLVNMFAEQRQENSKLAAQLSQMAHEDEKLVNMFVEQRTVSYVMAAPDKVVMPLQGVQRASKAEGMLMIASEGGSGVLMAKGLEPSSLDTTYHVWLSKDGQRVTVGRLYVDDTGWGIFTLWPDQPITLFQEVGITEQPVQGAADPDRSPVLWGTIAAR